MRTGFIAAFALLVASTVGVVAVEAAVETIVLDGAASVSTNGRALTVTGAIACDAGQRARITVSPMSASLNALGRTAVVCTGTSQPFEVTVRMRGSGTHFSDLSTAQLFVGANTGDGMKSTTQTVTW